MTTQTREELLKLAKEVANIGIKGDDDARSSNYFIFSEPMLERFAALLSAHQAQSAGFPARIYDLLTEVASRVPPEGRGVWEDGNGEPLQDDADAALAWIAAHQAQGERARTRHFEVDPQSEKLAVARVRPSIGVTQPARHYIEALADIPAGTQIYIVQPPSAKTVLASPAAQSGAVDELPPLPEPLEIDWPELHSQALGCGVEDRGIRDRYEAAEYGWQDGVDKAIERVPEEIFDADQVREAQREAYELGLSRAQTAPAVDLVSVNDWKPLPGAEFLSKRLARVAKLAGVTMPDMTHEQIAEVAGTILGQIARELESAATSKQPAAVLVEMGLRNILANFHRNNLHPEADAGDVEAAISAIKRIFAPQPPAQTAGVPEEGPFGLALNVKHKKCHKAADAFWAYWNENGETHRHGYYESTWGAINAAIKLVGVVPHTYGGQISAAPQPVAEQAGEPEMQNLMDGYANLCDQMARIYESLGLDPEEAEGAGPAIEEIEFLKAQNPLPQQLASRPTMDEQVERLRRKWPQAHVQLGAHGEHLVIVPSIALPEGWSATIGTLLFIAPAGFPFSHPDCFWIDVPDLQINGKHIQQTNSRNLIPGFPTWRDLTWFKWHLQAWNPNHDTLMNVVHSILHSLAAHPQAAQANGGEDE